MNGYASGIPLVDRAVANAVEMYPDASVSVRSHRGRPVITASEGNLVRLVRYENLDERRTPDPTDEEHIS